MSRAPYNAKLKVWVVQKWPKIFFQQCCGSDEGGTRTSTVSWFGRQIQLHDDLPGILQQVIIAARNCLKEDRFPTTTIYYKLSSLIFTLLTFSLSRGSVSLISHSEFRVGVLHWVLAEPIMGMANTEEAWIRSWPSPTVILHADCTFQVICLIRRTESTA